MTFMPEYDIDDRSCLKCDSSFTHSRHCTALHCDDGWIDEAEDDPINYTPGEEFVMCEECSGTGIEWWCPKCGTDLSKLSESEEEEENEHHDESF